MGKFEDLVAAVENGDMSALETLKKEYSGTALREKAEKSDALEARLAEALPAMRQAEFAKARDALPEDLKGTEFNFSDFNDMAPEDITTELLTEKARSQQARISELQQENATAAGYESVEEFNQAMSAMKAAQDAKRSGMESVGGGTLNSSSAKPVGSEDELTPFEAGKATFEEAKDLGMTDDKALGEAAHSIMAAQAPVEL